MGFDKAIGDRRYDAMDTPATVSRGAGGLPSWFDVTGWSVAAIGAACAEIATW